MDAELADGVVHQDGEVLHHHPDVPVGPAALIRPVLVALVLQGAARGRLVQWTDTGHPLRCGRTLGSRSGLAGVAEVRAAQ